MPQLRQGEARGARFPGGQPALYEALCPLRGPALSAGDDQGHCRGAEARLGYGQDVGEAVHASPARPRVEREMRPGLVMVLKIPRQDAAQVMLVKDDDVIQTCLLYTSDAA